MSSASSAVFLSYASQDANVARKICDALRAAEVEVWFDQSELRGGDAWDQKIRRQIRECALFIPLISANTQSRREGYFRLEWKLADDRTHLMARGTPFLLPVCIDDTKDWDAIVPDSFTIVQWVRLPGGETNSAFGERVKTLLRDGEIVGAALRRDDPADSRRKAPPTRKPINRWLVPVSATVAVISALAISQPWKKGDAAATVLAPKAEGRPTLPLSEAQQLTRKARALIDDDWMAVRENFRLAEELGQRAVTLAPDDGEAWATLARVSVETFRRSYDTRPQRRDAARNQAERAIRLAPDSIEAGLAMADYFAATGENAEAEKQFRRLLARTPRDPRVALGLASCLDVLNRDAEATEIRLHHPAFAGKDPRPLLDEARRLRIAGQLVEAGELIDRAQELAPTPEGYRFKLVVLGLESGELEAARVYLEGMPPQLLLEDATASRAVQVWLRLGRGDKAIEVLNRIPRDFFEENFQIFPKGYFMGWALRIAGRATAAEAEWKQALAVVEKRLAAEPNKLPLLHWKALLLALTGQTEEATKVLRLEGEFSVRSSVREDLRTATVLVALGRIEETITLLRAASGRGVFAIALCQTLRHDPWFASIRSDPRVQQIIVDGDTILKELRQAGATRTPPRSASSSEPPTPNSEPSRPPADAKSVAVLAFANIPDDKSNEYFSDGISEELLNVLAKIPGLKVTARTSAFHFKGKDTPIPEIARQLGVAYVVEGSVRKIGTQLRIAARLLNGTDGTQVWADNFREELKDVFALQDKIAGFIAKNLAMKLGTGVPVALATAPPTKDLAAYDAYLRGRALQTGGQTRPTVRETVQFYEEAVRIDPGYTLAWARLSQAHLWLDRTAVDRSEPHAANARDAAEKAVRTGDDVPEAHLAMAAVCEWIDRDYAAAQRHVDRAERLSPNNPEVFAAHARLEFARGNWGAGLATLVTRSVELDPQSVEPLDFGSRILMEVGRFAECEQLLSRWSALAPTLVRPRLRQAENYLAWTGDANGALGRVPEVTDELPRSILAWMTRASIYEAMGNLDSAKADYERRAEGRGRVLQHTYRLGRLESRRGNEARAAVLYAQALTVGRQREIENPEEISTTSTLALIHAALRQRSEALAAMAIAVQRATEIQDAPRLLQTRRSKAEMLGILGDVPAAVAELQAVHDQGYGFGYTLRLHPRWEPLRGNAKFQQLMKEAEARADAQPRPKK